MGSGDTARANHDTARDEIVERIRSRDHVLLTYLGAASAIFGLSLGTNIRPEILLVVPYLALGTTVIASQHDRTIGSISSFLSNELEPFMQEIDEWAPHWESSESLHGYASEAMWLRTIGHLLVIALPALAGLGLTFQVGTSSPLPLTLLWWSGVLVAGIAIAILIRTHGWRQLHYRKTSWIDPE